VEFWPDVAKHVFHQNQDAPKPDAPASGTGISNLGSPQ
jgi:hypothetical protein